MHKLSLSIGSAESFCFERISLIPWSFAVQKQSILNLYFNCISFEQYVL